MTHGKAKYLFAAAAALIQTGVLGYMIESRASILRSGQEVVLETVPVDPRDLLRGDYVILSYPISQIEAAKISGTVPPSDGAKPVYIALMPGEGGRHGFSRASWQPIADLKPEEVLIVGQTPDYFYMGTETVPLNFGLERYYVPEGEGRPIEDGVREKSVDVVAVINKAGKAQIKGLRLNGETLYEEPLY